MLSGIPWVRCPLGKAHAHDGIPGFCKCHEDGLIRLGARIRLDVRGLRTEDLLYPVNCQLLGDIHVLAATVIALARVPFRVLVGELRSLGFHDRGAHIVLGRNQFDVIFLATIFCLDCGPEFRVGLGNGALLGKHGFVCSK